MICIFLGPPGSGKGTQAVDISKRLNVPHVATGDMFRVHLKENTELGKKARAFMDQGALVPDEIVIGMLLDRISAADCSRGFLLDGFPRTVPQAESLGTELKKLGKAVNHVINFSIASEKLVARLSGRRTCTQCGLMYHVSTKPTKVEGVCDSCGGKVIQRTDDQESVIKQRLEVYERQTSPLIGFYESKHLLRGIDADRLPSDVSTQILTHLV